MKHPCCLLLALTLAANLLLLPAAAEAAPPDVGVSANAAVAEGVLDTQGTGSSVNNNSPEPSSGPTLPPPSTPAPQPTPVTQPTPSQQPASTASPEPAASATPFPSDGSGVYVVAATTTDAAGGELSTIPWGQVFNVVLRVVDHSSARYTVRPEDIAARVNSSVFTYTGIGEISQLVEASDQNGPYYSYILLFRDVIYNGGGNTFPIDLSYLDSSLPMQQFSVTLGQCVDKDPDDPSKLRTPNLVVRQSSYGTSAVTAGNPFTLNVTVYATDGSESLSDVIVSVTLPDGITLTGGSLSSYVGSMSPRGTREVSFPVLPSAAYTNGVANITVNMTGTGAKTGNPASGSTIISVPVGQPDRFEITGIEINDTIYIGQGSSVLMTFVNKGRNPVANLDASISGNNLGADVSQQYIGNVNAGSEGSVEFDLNPETPGPMDGVITLTYEAQDGTVKQASKSFSANVSEPEMDFDPGMMDIPVEPEPSGFPIWGWALIGAGVLGAGTAGVVLYRKRRKAKALASLEGEDEDL